VVGRSDAGAKARVILMDNAAPSTSSGQALKGRPSTAGLLRLQNGRITAN
jgi:hypothetical protein